MLIAATITTVAALVALVAILARVTPPRQRWPMLACALGTLPMCWIMFHHVRLPVDAWLTARLGEVPLLAALRTCYAPLTEEPAKLWPLLFPFVARAIERHSLARFALALGCGFALGEVWTVASLIAARQPEVAALPWYSLTPFIFERLETFVIHGAMTAVALATWRFGGGLAAGLVLAMLAHWAVNFPITMAQLGWLGGNTVVAKTMLTVWVTTCTLGGAWWLAHLDIGQLGIGRWLYGRARCPDCQREYDRRLLGLNFGSKRYEPCPYCRQWHVTQGIRAASQTRRQT